MDPNETLKRLRALIKKLSANSEQDGVPDLDDVDEVIELFQALDQWMKGGGFPPSDWLPQGTVRMVCQNTGAGVEVEPDLHPCGKCGEPNCPYCA